MTRIPIAVALATVPFLLLPGIDDFALLPKLLGLQVLLLVALACWVRSPKAWRPSPIYLPLMAWYGIMALSVFWAYNPFRTGVDLSNATTYLILFVVAHQTLERKDIPVLLRVTVIAGGLVSLYGILEYLSLIPDIMPSTGRPSATFAFRNLAADYLVASVPLAGVLWIASTSTADRLTGSIGGALMAVFLIYTRARGAWVGLFCATLLVLGVWAWSNRHGLWGMGHYLTRPAIASGICGLCLVGVLAGQREGFSERHLQRFDDKKDSAVTALTSITKPGGDRGRWKMWGHTLEMVAAHPHVGVGLGNWEYIYPQYDPGDTVSPTQQPVRPHNEWLRILAELGIVGFAIRIWLLGTVVYVATLVWSGGSFWLSMHRDGWQGAWVAGGLASLFAVVGSGMFGFPWERVPPNMVVMLGLVVVALAHSDRRTGLHG